MQNQGAVEPESGVSLIPFAPISVRGSGSELGRRGNCRVRNRQATKWESCIRIVKNLRSDPEIDKEFDIIKPLQYDQDTVETMWNRLKIPRSAVAGLRVQKETCV